jgi:hypothetical protein
MPLRWGYVSFGFKSDFSEQRGLYPDHFKHDKLDDFKTKFNNLIQKPSTQ